MIILNPSHESLRTIAAGKGSWLLDATHKVYDTRTLVFRHLDSWGGRTIEREFVISTIEDDNHLDQLLRHAQPMLTTVYRGAYPIGE